MFTLFQRSPTPPTNRPSPSASKAAGKKATIDFYKNKIKWLETGAHPTPLLTLTCRDVPLAELDGITASTPKPFVKKALRYYKKLLKELA